VAIGRWPMGVEGRWKLPASHVALPPRADPAVEGWRRRSASSALEVGGL
jgi:hypothetical protein